MGLRVLLLAGLVPLGCAAQAGEPDEPPPERRNASGGELIPEQAAVDVLHVDLTLTVDPKRRTIRGHAATRLRVLDPPPRFVLDLDGRLEVSAVEVDGAAAQFEHADGRIRIVPPAPPVKGAEVELLVRYGGAPRVAPNPPWDGGFTWDETPDGRPWIATSCQGEGADLWWPCKDHPSDKPETMDLWITVPEDLVCAANGRLVADEVLGEGRRFHWRIDSPISNYNVALNIGPYDVIESSFPSVFGDDVPVFFWVLPQDVEQARAALPEFLDQLAFHEEIGGPYPFRAEKYGIVQTPHLGMEHQTIIAYGNRFRGGPAGFDWLHHHESAHEWWANLITCRDWKDMWLHEGFATYSEALYLERRQGSEAYLREMERKRASLNDLSPIAPRRSMDSKEIGSFLDGGHDNDVYFKGSWVLHTLRWLIGDEAFFESLRRFAYPTPELEHVTDGSQVRFVDTEDFVDTVERVVGRELDWFFEVYVREADLPELLVDRRPRGLHLSWRTPATTPFPMPVPVAIDGTVRRIPVPDTGCLLAVGEDQEVAIDPENRVLKLEGR